MESVWTVLRLVEAGLLGGLIGYERERTNQPAGLRTHIILCLGAALMMIISQRVAEDTWDPGRIAAQVVSGIGFLGAGAILRMGASVRGITTAASIWTTTGIGLAVGAGYHVEAVSAVVIMLVALAALKKIGRRLTGKLRHWILDIKVAGGDEQVLEVLEDIISKERCAVREVDVKKSPEDESMSIRFHMTSPRDFHPPHLAEALRREPSVREVEIH